MLAPDRLSTRPALRKALLDCGIASSLLYVAANMLGARRWRDYSLASQTVSELSAVGAPSRPLVVPLLTAHGVLVIPFGVGVRESAGRRRGLRVAGSLLVGLGASDLPAPLFPMHRREALARGERSRTDTMHIVLTSVNSVLILLAIAFASTALGNAVPALLARDPRDPRGRRRSDSHADFAGFGEPANAVGGNRRANQHRWLPPVADGHGHRSPAGASRPRIASRGKHALNRDPLPYRGANFARWWGA